MKRVLFALGATSVLFVSAAFGQSLSDAQKRRLHLPYVRAATDCYARAIEANTSALDLAVQGRWYDALSAVGKTCDAPALAMINVHDQLYGPGTGANFFKGPYAEDLPRAVGTRLSGAIARRSSEVEQANAVRKQRSEEAAKARDLLRDRMYACTTSEIEDLVASSESAEVLATAAMTICNKEVQAALDAAMEVVRLDGVAPDGIRSSLNDVIKKNVVTSAVQARASARKAQPPAQALPAALPKTSSQASNIQTPENCLKDASSLREGQLVDQEKLISTMLDICRPEIENAARVKFLADPTQSLADLRTQALESAVRYAKVLVEAR
ncbi:hypothetical protein [Microvirga splendida]|uniref:Uncharacterized protein n=1 Tax=Microvirga splendida TaxID=2795727 RepID=A0ABS0XZJ3_9HYPH|nr:hypothetical protein [Microvirga splendida]MBJ6125467.1 hypothetical protein [Microvirga splendida]